MTYLSFFLLHNLVPGELMTLMPDGVVIYSPHASKKGQLAQAFFFKKK